MLLTRVLGTFLAGCAVSHALVEFDKSRLFDETDFQGKAVVYNSLYCSEGCQIYVSVPEASVDVAKQILVDDASATKTSLFDANTKDADGHKIPYVVAKGNAQVNFLNQNDGQKSAPILVWIVRGDAPNIDNVEVYDGDTGNRNSAPAKIITILDAEPFVVISGTFGSNDFPFYAITAGFDAVGSPDNCEKVIRQDQFHDLSGADIRSPLFTMVFNSGETEITLLTLKDPQSNLDLSRNQFVTSPGYIGCDVKKGTGNTKTFRSSLYEDKTEYHIYTTDTVSFTLSADLNVDKDHAVEIVTDGGTPLKWDGMNDDAKSIGMNAKDLKITWTRNQEDLDQYFMIRVEPDVETKTTTVVEEDPVKTTTVEVIETTTEKVEEPEPVRTTTLEPQEPEPEKTTTAEVPIPDKSTTVQPEEPGEDKTTTTSKPDEPEPEITTTMKPDVPEPELTTTIKPDGPEPVITTSPKPDEPVPEPTTTEAPEPAHKTKPPRRTTSLMPTTAIHPKSTSPITQSSTTTTTTPKPTTSGANYGSILLLFVLASAMFLA